jgi:LacI family transcriptional regulator
MLGPFGDESGAEAAAAVVRAGYTACFVASDVLAFGMLRRFKAMGVRVPADIAMVGCEGLPGADYCSPSLTTLTSPSVEAGAAAAALLLTMMAEVPGSETVGRGQEVLPSSLVLRESTAIA